MEARDFEVGQRVMNRHRQSCDSSQAFRDEHKGVVVSLQDGCNGLVEVLFDSRDFTSDMVPDDLRPCY